MEYSAQILENHLDNAKESKLFKKVFGLAAAGMIIDASDVYMAGAVNSAMLESKFMNLAQSSLFISSGFMGLFLGSLFAGYIGDRFGRKQAYQINLLIFGIATLLGSIAPNIQILTGLRLIAAFGLGAEIVTGYAIVNEFAPTKNRGKWSGAVAIIANLGAPIALMLSLFIIPKFSWRAMFIIVSLLSLVLWSVRRHFPESPRWLISKGRNDEANKIINQLELSGSYQSNNQKSKTKEINHPKYQKALIITSVAISAIMVSQYMFTSWVPTLLVQKGINISHSLEYTMFMMTGAPIGALISTLIIDRIGRKKTIISAFTIGGFLAISYSLNNTTQVTIAIGFLLTMFFYILMASVVGVYASELFQTSKRFRGTGWANAIAKLLTVLTPYLATFAIGKSNPAIIFYVIAILMFIAAITVLTIGPETKKQDLS